MDNGRAFHWPAFIFFRSATIATAIVASGHCHAFDESEFDAFYLCKRAILLVSRDPDKTDIPHVASDCGEQGCYSYIWNRSTALIRARNGLGLDVPAEAKCKIVAGGVRFLEFDHKAYINSPYVKPQPPKTLFETYGTGTAGFEAWAQERFQSAKFRYEEGRAVLIAPSTIPGDDYEKAAKGAAVMYGIFVPGSVGVSIRLFVNNVQVAAATVNAP